MARLIVPAAVFWLLLAGYAGPAGAAEPTYFQSPSGNIACAIYRGARCDIKKKDWKPPPKPKTCPVDWGFGLEVGKKGRGRYLCAGDSVFGGPKRVLKYGRSVSRGPYTCKMRAIGVRCINRSSSHGFFLSRQNARLF